MSPGFIFTYEPGVLSPSHSVGFLSVSSPWCCFSFILWVFYIAIGQQQSTPDMLKVSF